MDTAALERIALWGTTAAWGLLPQALIAVAMAVLASQRRLKPVVFAYSVALAALGVAASMQLGDGARLMQLLNLLFCAIAVVALAALGPRPLEVVAVATDGRVPGRVAAARSDAGQRRTSGFLADRPGAWPSCSRHW